MGRAAIGGHLGQAVLRQSADEFPALISQAAVYNSWTGRVDFIPTLLRSGAKRSCCDATSRPSERGPDLVCQLAVAARVDLTLVSEGRVFALARASPEASVNRTPTRLAP